ncbi:hemolysin family protein [Paenibacillus sp. MSJ-34]|uniref:hemolysin family protein n=1 Tax=Paenibacillus sp. MSJ-34 TaxID=2841529 RepID=UPI001C1015B2|nr:hemolysin family protein [Paenibacillus sp. MSJ-34]MBU5442619.1 hemolysin family protein [Paenibacillus sp. MSJ-34]
MNGPLPGAVLNLFLVLLLVLLNGFFVAAEFAMVKVRGSRIDALIQKGEKRANFARNVVDNLDSYLSATQLGITLASLGLGWIGEPAVADLLRPLFHSLGLGDALIHTVSFIIAFALITILHIVLGELAPKSMAIRMAEKVTLLSAPPLVVFYKTMYPFIWILNGLANGLLRSFGIAPASEHESAHTEEEIRILMKESNQSGLIDNTELTLVDNIFEFADRTAREIMIPRTEMICLYTNLSQEENKEIALKEMKTRYPVCDQDKDHIIGFIHVKDLLKAREMANRIRDQGMGAMIRPIASVPESIQISTLLKMMQKNKSQIAILIDEYGGTSGLVTLEDIMEEIVGEIQDEFDEERPGIEKVGDDEYSIDGLLLIDVVNDYFGLDIDSDDFDTIGGWLYSQIEIPPLRGQSVKRHEYEFAVEETDHLRISRIKLYKRRSAAASLEDSE